MKLLVVDDEPSIREGICHAIDWESHGIQCVEAKDGIQALERIEREMPDLVLLDVRMPNMDGLNVMEELKRWKIEIKVIILSGYDQFSYAQKALKCGAVDYLIKPCHKNHLLETVLHFKEEIAREQRSASMAASLQKQFQENIRILQEQYLCRILENSMVDMQTVKENFETLHIELPLYGLAVVILEMDCAQCILFRTEGKPNEKDMALARFGVTNIAEELFVNPQSCKCVVCDERIAAIVDMGLGGEQIELLLQDLKKKVMDYLGISLTVGVGTMAKVVTEISLSYRKALQALEVKELLGTGEIYWHEKIFLPEEEENHYSIYAEKKVIEAIFSRKAPELYRMLDFFFDGIGNAGLTEQYKKYSLTLCHAINHAMEEYSISNKCAWKTAVSLKKILWMQDANSIREMIVELACEAQNLVIHMGSNNRQILQNAITFIRENYQSDIGLKDAAEHVYLSPNYFSMMFKQLSGVSYVDYLNSVRVEKACELLKNSGYKTYEVAFQAGFKDEKYFSYIFKKVTGQSPSQYKKGL